jgi:hypothetical protein
MGGQTELGQHARGPAPFLGVEHLGGGRDGVLGHLPPGQPEVEEVGQHEHVRGHVQLGIARMAHGVELDERVEFEKLDARLGEDVRLGHAVEDDGQHAHRAHIAVVGGVTQQLSVGVEQTVVDAPRVHTDGRRHPLAAPGIGRQPCLDLVPQPQNIPMLASGHVGRSVGKAMQHLQRKPCTVPLRQQHAPVRRTQVGRQKINC